MGNIGGKKNKDRQELTKEDIAIFKKYTNFSEEEIRDWHAGFLNDCPNGTLDKKHFTEIFKKYYVEDKRADYFCNYVFKMHDKDKHGQMDFTEFLLTIASSTQGDLRDRLEIAFDMYDVSCKGKMNEEELTELIKTMYNMIYEKERDPKQRAREIIKEVDEDHDGELTKEEFIKACHKDRRFLKMLAPNQYQDWKSDSNTHSSLPDTQA